jgi:hypothetical protein
VTITRYFNKKFGWNLYSPIITLTIPCWPIPSLVSPCAPPNPQQHTLILTNTLSLWDNPNTHHLYPGSHLHAAISTAQASPYAAPNHWRAWLHHVRWCDPNMVLPRHHLYLTAYLMLTYKSAMTPHNLYQVMRKRLGAGRLREFAADKPPSMKRPGLLWHTRTRRWRVWVNQ